MDTQNKNSLDMDAVRAKLAGARGKQYWRRLGELLESPETRDLLAEEIPQSTRMAGLHVDRRQFLTLAGASLALAGLSGCRMLPEKKLVPYVRKPEEMIEGIPLFYATAIPGPCGLGMGALVTSREGRPIKMEGNPDHPASLGRLDAFGQASILPMYDPDRAQVVTSQGEVATWKEFFDKGRAALNAQQATGGAGIRILTETVTSPTLADQMHNLLTRFPQAQWIQYEPASRESARAASVAAFGSPTDTIYDFSKAARILSLDADFLMSMPGSVRYGREFIDGRRVRGGTTVANMNRLYVVESSPSITGAMADHKMPLRPSQIEPFARAVAQGLGVASGATGTLDAAMQKFVTAVVNDLKAQPRGTTLVVPGDYQSPAVHVLAHAINDALGNTGTTVTHINSVAVAPTAQAADLARLVEDIRADKVQMLLILGGNPVYNAPAELRLREQIVKVPFGVHLGMYEDETSELCQWHLPEAHFLEAWSDIRAFDGTASIIQPLIAPLYDGKSAHEVISGLAEEPRDGYAIVSDFWARQGDSGLYDFNRLLHDGVVANSAFAPKAVTFNASALAAFPAPAPITLGADAIEVTLRPDPSIWDGRYSNNGWLQELPKPFVKLTWDNGAYMSPDTAAKHRITVDTDYAAYSDIIEVAFRDAGGVVRKEKVPVIIQPGVPEDTVNLFLGYGRTRAGSLGTDIGYNAYNLFTAANPWQLVCNVSRTSDKYPLAVTTHHQVMEGRDIIRVSSIAQFQRHPSMAPEENPQTGGEKLESDQRSTGLEVKNDAGGTGKDEQPNIYPSQEWEWPQPGDSQYGAYKWGMVIDTGACIGCNACMVACQAENNIPIVGKQQVLTGRHMNWIRIDTYYESDPANESTYVKNPGTYFQPLMCVHCEQAPCEPVCPVAATVHSHEGLNQMIYNRCIGTKYCSNNCPYKVRRFNFLNYANHWDIPVVKMRNNPEVTVRGRGVMEKCSYCTQRINGARQKAKIQGRDVLDGEIQTACQQTCPTNAIVFGNIRDPNSAVAKLKAQPHDYGLLADLNTRPRTTYLGRVRNPNPELEEQHVG